MAFESLPVRRVALILEYDGTNYRGLQRQGEYANTIQAEVEKAVATLGTANVGFICAGRTDAGVHATGQVVAVNIPQRLSLERIARSLNSLLPADIRVMHTAFCGDDFSPRLNAVMRTYIYRMSARVPVSPLYRNRVAFTPYSLPIDLTQAAAQAFVGKWEMCEWRASSCQAKRTLLTISEVLALPPTFDASHLTESVPYWRFMFRARSFLHHQVRFMVGAIVGVAQGRIQLDELRASLANGTRPHRVKMEEARGLCLTHVEFADGKNPFAATTLDP